MCFAIAILCPSCPIYPIFLRQCLTVKHLYPDHHSPGAAKWCRYQKKVEFEAICWSCMTTASFLATGQPVDFTAWGEYVREKQDLVDEGLDETHPVTEESVANFELGDGTMRFESASWIGEDGSNEMLGGSGRETN
jgi:hypothetical protein